MSKLTRNAFWAALTIMWAVPAALALDNPAGVPATGPTATPTVPPLPPTPVVISTSNAVGPRVQFAEPIYDFGRVQNGDPVKHSYLFTNNGDQPLEVSNVQPSCGCTTAGDWTRKVMPGQTGSVAIQFNSSHFSGDVFKTISVTSNDKQHPVTVLQLKGKVWKPLELLPSYAIMNAPPDATSVSTSIRIVNNTEEPLMLSPPECNNKSYSVKLNTTKPGKEYQLEVESVGDLSQGNVQGKIMLKTSWTNTPMLEVPFWVNIQPALSISPPHIMLPRTLAGNRAPTIVTIQNNSTNALTVSDPVVNLPDVKAQITEVQPGKIYRATLTFPDGFEIPVGPQVLLTMKSSNPRNPEIRVPISQAPRPVVAAPRPAVAPPPLPGSLQPASSALAAKPATAGQATQ